MNMECLPGPDTPDGNRSLQTHIEDIADMESVRQMIRAGRALLTVVAYPWGVEFDLRERTSDTEPK